MKIDFYYWNYQCPISNEMLNLLRDYENIIEINYHDIQEKPLLAEQMKIFFPFLTVFDDTLRWKSPLSRETLENYVSGNAISEKPYVIAQGETVYKGALVALNADTIDLLAKGCTLGDCKASCQKKQVFLQEQGSTFYGMLHLKNRKVVGGVEVLPSVKVPYDVPKSEDTAFLTCVYHSSTEMDYKAYPLAAVEKQLANSFTRIIAISDEQGAFPNGNLQWFLAQGYVDEGVIAVEANYCTLHLVSKTL